MAEPSQAKLSLTPTQQIMVGTWEKHMATEFGANNTEKGQEYQQR